MRGISKWYGRTGGDYLMESHVYHSIPCVRPVPQSHVGQVGLSCGILCVPLQLVYPVCPSCPTVSCRTGGTVLQNHTLSFLEKEAVYSPCVSFCRNKRKPACTLIISLNARTCLPSLGKLSPGVLTVS